MKLEVDEIRSWWNEKLMNWEGDDKDKLMNWGVDENEKLMIMISWWKW